MPGSTAPPWSIPYALLSDTADANVLSKSMADRLQVLFQNQVNNAVRFDLSATALTTGSTGAIPGTLTYQVGGWTVAANQLVVPTTAPYFMGLNLELSAVATAVAMAIYIDGATASHGYIIGSGSFSISGHLGTVVPLNAGQKIWAVGVTTSGSINVVATASCLFAHSII